MSGTESRNSNSTKLDQMDSLAIVSLMNQEDQTVPLAIKPQLDKIAAIVDMAVQSFQNSGRLIYLGAGTSGRLGVLDAAECVPTFGIEPEMVQGLIAGGEEAMTIAVEGAEDSIDLAVSDLLKINLSKNDLLVGIAASGRTPYVIGGLDYARKIGAKTASIACNLDAKISHSADVAVEVETGPEVLTGSTRLKAGTAQKLILNMISTASMTQVGKVYQNLMVDVKPTNIKLVDRAKRIISEATGISYDEAEVLYEQSQHQPKIAIVMALASANYENAKKALEQSNGFVKKALDIL